MADVTTGYANKNNLWIYIQHVPSGKSVRFKGMLNSFSDNFESNWSSEEVYGRMDPIETFQGTKRIIEMEWDVVSFSLKDAKENLARAGRLANFLYPVYGDYGNANSITSAPILRMRFSNLVSQPSAPGAHASKGAAEEGLVGRLAGYRYTPDLDSGVHLEKGKMYPQTISIQATFHVFHTHDLGWRSAADGEAKLRAEGFPHGADLNIGEPDPTNDSNNIKVSEAARAAVTGGS